MPDLDADVVVVGSGCTGGWASKILTEAGHSVLVLEAGRAISASDYPLDWYRNGDRRAAVQTDRHHIQKNHPAFCESNRGLWVDDIDNPYVTDPADPFVWIRARIEGGRSNLWGGQCWRLTRHELEAPAIDGIGERWPLEYEDLVPYYEQVEGFHAVTGCNQNDCDVPDQVVTGAFEVTPEELRMLDRLRREWRRGATPARSAGASEQPYGSSGSWPRFSSLGSTLPAARSTGRLQIVTDAVVARLEVDQGARRASEAVYIDATTGREHRVRAQAFILCASTIESTRILLCSASAQHPHGLGNSSGVLGRYLMDHIGTVAIGTIDAPGSGADSTFFGGRNGLYLPRLGETGATPSFHRSYGCWISLGRPMGHGQNAIVTAIGEMLPYPDNRVVLDPERVDRWGLPVPSITCIAGDNERAMRRHQRDTVARLAELAEMDITVGPTHVALGAMVHEVGTARMGSDPRTSYCNSFAQSWDVPNVFVPDGACWTTSAYQNPTLTMMALAARSARYVGDVLSRHRS